MSLTLTLRQPPPGRISLVGITPDRLALLPVAAIERLPLRWGRESLVLGDLFRVGGSPDDHLLFEGGDGRFVELGAGMAAGTCELVGDGGDFLARDMRGGRLVVRGSVERFAASGMAGGELHIAGDAGDHLGAALPWLAAGMRGGRVVVDGNVGSRCADKLRRGEIFVGGSASSFCAARMVAGTVVVAGDIGPHAAYAMRRGSLLVLGTAWAPPPTFVETVMCADAYLGLLWRDWVARFAADSPFAGFARRAMADKLVPRRWMGDLGSDGRGEVLGFGG